MIQIGPSSLLLMIWIAGIVLSLGAFWVLGLAIQIGIPIGYQLAEHFLGH